MTVTMHQESRKGEIMEVPSYIVTQRSEATEQSSESGKGVQKKHVLIVVGVTVLAGLIITGILVGMYIFAEAQKEIVKFSLNFKSGSDGGNVKQEVVSDPNDNVVQYHVTKDGKRVDIVNDFNREIQVVRMESDFGTNCYVSALNRSAAADPSQITGPDHNAQSDNSTSGSSTMLTVSSSPVSDRTFLPKKALDMCKDVSVYWAYRTCASQNSEDSDGNVRTRRDVCVTGCCIRVCSCSIRVYVVWSAGRMSCTFVNTCSRAGTYRRVC